MQEAHVFVLWPHALNRSEQILEDIAARFTILDVFRIHWSDRLFSRNLSRFYSSALPPGSDKERHCGRGPFLLVVARDEAPAYAPRATSKGRRAVNEHMFDARLRYRGWTGRGHRVHASLSAGESAHDRWLLLGDDGLAYDGDSPAWRGDVVDRAVDLAGASGWRSSNELYAALDLAAPYVVVSPPDRPDRDVVALTANVWDSVMVANGVARRSGDRVLHDVPVADAVMTFDFQQFDTGYVDAAWERALLERAGPGTGGARTATSEDRSFVSLYRHLVHGEPHDGAGGGDQVPLDGYLTANGYETVPWQPLRLHIDDDLQLGLPRSPDAEVAPSPEWRAPGSVSAIVVSYNTRDCLERSLSALTATGIETVVVDNASTDGSVELVETRFPSAATIVLPENVGFGAAANEALKRSEATYVLLLNADAWPRGNPVPRLVALADDRPQTAVLAPALVNPDGSAQRSVFGYPTSPASLALYIAFPQLVSVVFRVWQRLRPSRARRRPFGEPRDCEPIRGRDFPAGAALLLRRDAVESVGLFDEDFFMYSEETDLCRRLQEAGWEVVFCPWAEFFHVGAAATQQNADAMQHERIRSYLRYIAKHEGEASAERARRFCVLALRILGRSATVAWLDGGHVRRLLELADSP